MSPTTPFRKVFHVVIGILFISTWSVHLFDLAAQRDYEPFKTIAFRARLEHFYGEHAPSKVDEVLNLVGRYTGREEKLVKQLEKKYDAPMAELNLGSLTQACTSTAWEGLQSMLPPKMSQALNRSWLWWVSLSTAEQFITVSLQALLFTLGMGTLRGDANDMGFTYLLTWGVLAIALVRPFPPMEAFNPASFMSGFKVWWRTLEAPREQLWAVSGLAAGLGLLRGKGNRSIVLLGWAAVVLYLTNPGAGITSAGYDMADSVSSSSGSSSKAVLTAAVKVVAGAKQSPTAMLQSLPPGSLKVHDLGLASVLTWAKSAQHGWLSPCFAVGAGGEWLGTVENDSLFIVLMALCLGYPPTDSQVEVKQGTMTMRGKPVPAWAVPVGLFGAFATLTMFAV